ncbi:hypothetical protein [Hyphomicrobium sp. D-2]|uniref:hypothetical protein n=1 Tax=Hyphomicrobium sp. D-2 TaxID=3041621 RepID=UPI0024573336|nr:hypothetical protein [Hyphomicrobium sp. D-2]MDH4983025.1 hypothetical protein [Hyphomicrobium sp. D-2]
MTDKLPTINADRVGDARCGIAMACSEFMFTEDGIDAQEKTKMCFEKASDCRLDRRRLPLAGTSKIIFRLQGTLPDCRPPSCPLPGKALDAVKIRSMNSPDPQT